MKQNLVLGIGVVAVVSLVMSFMALGKPAVIKEVVEQAFGATPGTDISSQDISIGGLKMRFVGQPIRATSSVICSIKSPAATSTLMRTGISGTNLSTAETLYMATSSTSYASSTPALAARMALGANQKFAFEWKGSVATTGVADLLSANLGTYADAAGTLSHSTNVLAPNTYINWRIATTLPGLYSTYPSGTCSAWFQQL